MPYRFVPLRRLGFGLALVLIAWAAANGARADTPVVSAAEDATRPFIVKIHADWCGACTLLNGTFEALNEKLGDRARIVVLDVSDRAAFQRSLSEAERLGLDDFFDHYKRWTGTVGVLDGATRNVVEVIQGELRPEIYEAAVERAVRGSAS